MKILISHDNSPAHYFIRLGLARAFIYSGIEAKIWNIHEKPALDALHEYQPDVLITQSYNIDDALYQAIKECPWIRVVAKASDYGLATEEIDLNEYPIKAATQKEINNIRQLKEETGQPELFYIHYPQKYVESTHNYWQEKEEIPTVSLLSACDFIDYHPCEARAYLQSDICWVGGRWSYKAKTLDPYLKQFCSPLGKYNIKLFGSGWNVPQACGILPTEEVKHLFCSSIICPNISEPHSQQFGFDVVERPFKILGCHAFCISDRVDGLREIFTDDELPMVESPEELKEMVNHFLKRPHERLRYMKAGFEKVVNHHSYFHRAEQILKMLESSEAQKCIPAYKEILKKIGIITE